MTHVTPLDVAGLAAAYRSGETSPRAQVEAALALIAARDGELNAFAAVLADDARAAADHAGRELRDGRDLGPLHGVPVAIKDLIEVAGAPTGYGTRAVTPRIATADATLVARLRAAGAIVLGKTNLLEFAYGIAHPAIGQTNNPVDPARTAGGSSGGSAAAVAAGIVPLAVGTDTGGSIRIPAAYCGIVGIKPTFGLVPLDGVFPLSWSLDHAGPLARSVSDAAVLLGCMAGRTMPLAAVAPEKLTLGVLRPHFPRDPANAPVSARIERLLADLALAGVTCRDIEIPGLDAANAALLDILLPEASVIHADLVARNPEGYAPGTRRQIEAGFETRAVDLVRARRVQDELRRAVTAALGTVDALVSPSVPFVAPHEDPEISDEGDSEMLASGFANLTGHPSVSIPAGRVGGLPVGLQLTGRLDEDAGLLSVAQAVSTLATAGP